MNNFLILDVTHFTIYNDQIMLHLKIFPTRLDNCPESENAVTIFRSLNPDFSLFLASWNNSVVFRARFLNSKIFTSLMFLNTFKSSAMLLMQLKKNNKLF